MAEFSGRRGPLVNIQQRLYGFAIDISRICFNAHKQNNGSKSRLAIIFHIQPRFQAVVRAHWSKFGKCLLTSLYGSSVVCCHSNGLIHAEVIERTSILCQKLCVFPDVFRFSHMGKDRVDNFKENPIVFSSVPAIIFHWSVKLLLQSSPGPFAKTIST